MSRPLKLAGANGRNEKDLTDYVAHRLSEGFSGVICSEAQRLIAPIDKILRTRITVPGGGWEQKGSREKSTLVVVDSRLPNIGELTREISEAHPAFERVAPQRALACSMFEHPAATRAGKDGVALFGFHPVAGPEALHGSDPQHPLVRLYAEAMSTLVAWVTAARRDNLAIVIGVDLQMRPQARQAWSPWMRLVRPFGLQQVQRDIDVMLIDSCFTVRNTHFTRMPDHWGIEVVLDA